MSEQPTLHLMCGLPGAGKTTVARDLELEHGAVRLTPDDWIHSMLPEGWTDEQLHSLRDPVEALQRALAERLLSLGVSVILDWGLWGDDEREALRALARDQGARVELHLLDPPREELLRRLKDREPGPGVFHVSEADIDLWDRWFKRPTPKELKTYD